MGSPPFRIFNSIIFLCNGSRVDLTTHQSRWTAIVGRCNKIEEKTPYLFGFAIIFVTFLVHCIHQLEDLISNEIVICVEVYYDIAVLAEICISVMTIIYCIFFMRLYYKCRFIFQFGIFLQKSQHKLHSPIIGVIINMSNPIICIILSQNTLIQF